MVNNHGIQLREYQNSSVNDIIEAIRDKKNTVVQLPTGTGKTTVIAEVVRLWRAHYSQNQRALVVVHRIELVEQIVERFLQFGITAGKIKAGEPVNANFQIQVGLIQSLRNQSRRPATLGLIIVDEAHHINASSYSDLISYYDSYTPTVIGVTATPSRLDGKPLGKVFNQLLEYGQITTFIENGYLSHMKHFATGFPELKQIKIKSTGDYDEKALEKEMSNDRIMANLIKGYEMHATNKKMIVFAVNTEHANIIANRYCASGYKAQAVDYKTESTIRKNIIADFKVGKIQILVNVNLFTEGFDCPDVEVVQLARPTKSLNLYLQMIGRGMRTFPGKEFGIILDNAKLWEEFGLATRERQWSIHGLENTSKNIIKVRLKSDSEENLDRENEIPEESNQLELIEIIEDKTAIISTENPVSHGEKKLLHTLLVPRSIKIIENDLQKIFIFSNSLKIAESEKFGKHFITGQYISTATFCKIIGINLSIGQKSISKNKLISSWGVFINSLSSKEFKIIHLCYNYIIKWHEKQNFLTLNPFREDVMKEDALAQCLELFYSEKAFSYLNLPEDFLISIKNRINLKEVEEIYDRIMEVHYDEIANILGHSGKVYVKPQELIDAPLLNTREIEKLTITKIPAIEKSLNEYRLAKVATELNRSFQNLADIINLKGFNIKPKPTTKITEEMYQILLSEFSVLKKANFETFSEKKRVLIKASLEINISYRILAKFLNRNGYKIESKPSAKITEEMYQLIILKYPKTTSS
jgi:superfamily II DNA or RNA helicase